MSAAVVQAAAKKGDRVAHESRFDDRDGSAMLAAAIGAATSGEGGASVCAAYGQAVSGGGSGALAITIRDVIPHGTTGELEKGSVDTWVMGLPAAVTAQHKVSCHRHRDKPIKTGSASVFVDKKRMARVGDQTCCGALVVDGAKTVLVGGASVEDRGSAPRSPGDDAPDDPLAGLDPSGAIGAFLGNAISAVTSAVELATGYGARLLDKAEHEVEVVADAAESTVSAVASRASGLLSDLEGAVLGSKGGDVAQGK